jgi:hypothetical protein
MFLLVKYIVIYLYLTKKKIGVLILSVVLNLNTGYYLKGVLAK